MLRPLWPVVLLLIHLKSLALAQAGIPEFLSGLWSELAAFYASSSPGAVVGVVLLVLVAVVFLLFAMTPRAPGEARLASWTTLVLGGFLLCQDKTLGRSSVAALVAAVLVVALQVDRLQPMLTAMLRAGDKDEFLWNRSVLQTLLNSALVWAVTLLFSSHLKMELILHWVLVVLVGTCVHLFLEKRSLFLEKRRTSKRPREDLV